MIVDLNIFFLKKNYKKEKTIESVYMKDLIGQVDI